MQRVRGLEQARVALSAGERQLISEPFAACYAGVNYFQAVLKQLHTEFPNDDFSFTLCCGDNAAIAHDALRLGFTSVLCDCGPGQFDELMQVAQSLGATLVRPSNGLDPAA